MEILMSVPGIGEISAATLIAEEIFKDFSSGDKLASWLGIVPNVYQSADKFYNGRIIKRGSKVARWILTQIAQAAPRMKNSKIIEFFNRKEVHWTFKINYCFNKKNYYNYLHLFINNEMYEDDIRYKKKE
jgi:transposase